MDSRGYWELRLRICGSVNMFAYQRIRSRLTNYSGSFGFILDNLRAADSTLSGEEGREIDRAFSAIRKSTNADALRLEVFKGSRNIQETLASRADDCHWGPSQLGKIRYNILSVMDLALVMLCIPTRNVHGVFSSAMHAT